MHNRKKILFYIEGISLGGQQTFNYTLIKHLNNFDNDITVAYYLDGDLHLNFEKVAQLMKVGEPPKNWIKATKNPFHIIRQALKMRRIIRENHFDFLVSNGPYTYFIAAIACSWTRTKHARLLGKEPSKEKTLWRLFNRLYFEKTTDLFLSFSYGNKELKSRGVKDNQMIDAINAVDTDFFRPSLSIEEKKSGRQQYGISEDELVIGWCGRIYENMEIKNTVKMLLELKKLGFDKYKFLVIGDGPYMEELKKIVIKSGLSDQTIYFGWQLPENVRDIIQYIDVMPLLDDDPIGGSIVREAMAAGVIVLSVDGKSGFQAEWVHHNVNGIMVKPENYPFNAALACIDLQKSPDKRMKLAQAGRNYAVEHLSFTVKSKIIDDAFNRLLFSN